MDEYLQRRKAIANGGLNVYVQKAMRDHPACPIDAGDDCIIQLVPHVGIVLLPADGRLEYPFTVPHPGSIAPEIDESVLPRHAQTDPPTDDPRGNES